MKRRPSPFPQHVSRPVGHGRVTASALAKTARLVSAYVVRNHVRPEDLPALIQRIYSCISGPDIMSENVMTGAVRKPADVQKSIRHDCIVSFLNGREYKSLKRHLSANGLCPDSYRARYGLPKDYPMVAPDYSAKRAEIARQIQLGSKAAA